MADIDDYADVVKPDEQGLLDRLEELVSGEGSDTNIKILSNMTGMDENHIRQVAVPLLSVVKKHGLNFISRGNSDRESSIKGKLKSVEGYASILVDFMPLIGAIKEMISTAVSNRIPNVDITEDEWTNMPSVDTIIDVGGREEMMGSTESDESDFLRGENVDAPVGVATQRDNPWEKLLKDWGDEYGAEAASEIRKDMEEKGLIKAKKIKGASSDSSDDEIEPDDSFFFD